MHLEEQLLHTKQLLQQVQTELQALEKSCLLQLARSSWIGRMLRSSTGSVEVSPCSPSLPGPPRTSPTATCLGLGGNALGTAHLALSGGCLRCWRGPRGEVP